MTAEGGSGRADTRPGSWVRLADVSWGRFVGIPLLFAVLTIAHTWPLARDAATHIQRDPDVTTGMWALTELAHQALYDPAHLMDGRIFYPYPGTIAVLDHQLASAVAAIPLVAAGAGGALVYNLSLLATFFLNGVFTWLLTRRLTGSDAAGIVAGCAFAFSSYHAYRLAQSHLLVTQWVPLALLMLHRFVERRTWSRWTALAIATLLVALSSWHIAVIGAIGIGIVALWTLASKRVDRKKIVGGLALIAFICGLALIPLAQSYQRMSQHWPPRTGEGRETLGTLAGNSANVANMISPPFNARTPLASVLPGADGGSGTFPGTVLVLLTLPALAALVRARGQPAGRVAVVLRWSVRISSALVVVALAAAAAGPAGAAFLDTLRPIAPMALFGVAVAVAGLAFAVRIGRGDADSDLKNIITYAALAAGGALLALGPRVLVGEADIGSGLWRFDLLPVRLIIRAPDRFFLLSVLGVAVLAGFGLARLVRGLSPTRSMALTTVALALLNVDLGFRMTELRPVPIAGNVEEWLATEEEYGAVIEYPLSLRRHSWPMFFSQIYDRRVVNGAGYLYPWEYRQMEDEEDLSTRQLAILWEYFHPRFAVVRTDRYAPARRRRVVARIEAQPEALGIRARFGDDFILELRDHGRGAELYRRWPRTALEGARGLELGGFITAGREDTSGELVVSLNGEVLLESRGDGVEQEATYRVAFDPEQLVAGSNLFTIWADYRQADTATSHPIGATGVSLPADVALRADRERARVQVNGRVFRPDKGYFLVVLDPYTGEVVDAAEFNVSWYAEDSEAMQSFIREIAPGSPVLLVTEFDASRELTAGAAEALRSLGVDTDLRGEFQMLHAAIGVKGALPGTALETTDPIRAELSLGEPDAREVQLTGLRLLR